MMICEHDKPHRPIRNFEERKNLRRDLNHQPADDRVRDRDLVNIAPLQLGEEILQSRVFAITHRQEQETEGFGIRILAYNSARASGKCDNSRSPPQSKRETSSVRVC